MLRLGSTESTVGKIIILKAWPKNSDLMADFEPFTLVQIASISVVPSQSNSVS